MSYASSVSQTFSGPDLHRFAAGLRGCGHVVGAALQTTGFAAVMWLLLAGPGFLAGP